jgi:N-formylglutamate amidohydrolase
MSAHHVIAGSERSSIVLHVPHGSRHIPAQTRAGMLLDDAELAAELDRMTDADTGAIAGAAADTAALRPWIFENLASRLVIDPERFPDEREEMRAVGMGAVYTRTSHGEPLRHEDEEQERRLLDEYFHPYAQAMTELVDDRLNATGHAVILDVHSYPSKPLPYELHPNGPRPVICLGTDAFHTPDWLLDAALTAFGSSAAFEASGEIELNTPFAGCYAPLRHYRAQPAVSAILVEIRRDAYLTEPAGPPTEGLHRVTAALARLIDLCDQRLPRSEHR